jgi:hypothetical protein
MKFKLLNGEVTTIQYSLDGKVFNYAGEVYRPYKGCWSADVRGYGRITNKGEYFETKKEAVEAAKTKFIELNQY